MNQTSPAATGTAGAVIAALVAVIAMINTRLKLDLSPQDQVSIAGGIVVAAHWIAQQVATYAKAKSAASVSTMTFALGNAAALPKVVLTGDGGAGGGDAAPAVPVVPQPSPSAPR